MTPMTVWVAVMDASERWVASGTTEDDAKANLRAAWNLRARPTVDIDDIDEYFSIWTYQLAPGIAYQDTYRFTIGNPS